MTGRQLDGKHFRRRSLSATWLCVKCPVTNPDKQGALVLELVQAFPYEDIISVIDSCATHRQHPTLEVMELIPVVHQDDAEVTDSELEADIELVVAELAMEEVELDFGGPEEPPDICYTCFKTGGLCKCEIKP